MNTATVDFTKDAAYQNGLSISESIGIEAARIYGELMDTEQGISQVLEALASEDLRGLEAMAMDAGLIARLEDEIPISDTLVLMNKIPNLLGYAGKQMWFAIDEMASRMAHRRAEKMAQRLGF